MIALGKIKNEDAVAGLIAALRHEDYHVRSATADELGSIGSTAAVPALILALNDADQSVRLRAANALEEIRTPEARAAARAFRRSKSTSA